MKVKESIDQRESATNRNAKHCAKCAILHYIPRIQLRETTIDPRIRCISALTTLAPDSVCNCVSVTQYHVASVESCMTATVTTGNEFRTIRRRNIT